MNIHYTMPNLLCQLAKFEKTGTEGRQTVSKGIARRAENTCI
jgi:hypothetical protein